MPKAEKEFLLNYSMNRWKLNQKKNVGPTSDSVRLCNPQSLDEWREYYFTNVRSVDHVDRLGERLYDNIKNILPNETRFHPELIDCISLGDCKAYMHMVVINRVYNGYMREHGK